jgi:hypothetical protein
VKNATINKGVIRKIAQGLGALNEQVVYVGGATVGLYINDPAADDVRPTKDVDISVSLASIGELERLREELSKKGFIQTAEDDVICRFRYDGVIVDVMNTQAIGWAPANPWFGPGFLHREQIDIDGQTIWILPLPFFLATKFAAYHHRGKNEPRFSHDFEDIIYVIDNRLDIVSAITRSTKEVGTFLKEEFERIINDPLKLEAISGNLYFETRDERYAMILDKLHAMVEGLSS